MKLRISRLFGFLKKKEKTEIRVCLTCGRLGVHSVEKLPDGYKILCKNCHASTFYNRKMDDDIGLRGW